jgi:hypothetical protein
MSHGRIHDGDTDQMIETAYQAWNNDLKTGKTSILVADNTNTVAQLNARARADRIAEGSVDPNRTVKLTEGNLASVGDLVITRRNERRLNAGDTGWVRNGDRWTITAIHDDGTVTAAKAEPEEHPSSSPPPTSPRTSIWAMQSPHTGRKASPWTPPTSSPHPRLPARTCMSP